MIEFVACFGYLLGLLVEVLNHICQPHALFGFWGLALSDGEVDKGSFADSPLREALVIFKGLSIHVEFDLIEGYFGLSGCGGTSISRRALTSSTSWSSSTSKLMKLLPSVTVIFILLKSIQSEVSLRGL